MNNRPNLGLFPFISSVKKNPEKNVLVYALGKIRSSPGSFSRKLRYCNSNDKNIIKMLPCLFDMSTSSEYNVIVIVSENGLILTSYDSVSWNVNDKFKTNVNLTQVSLGNFGQNRIIINNNGITNSIIKWVPSTQDWEEYVISPQSYPNQPSLSTTEQILSAARCSLFSPSIEFVWSTYIESNSGLNSGEYLVSIDNGATFLGYYNINGQRIIDMSLGYTGTSNTAITKDDANNYHVFTTINAFQTWTEATTFTYDKNNEYPKNISSISNNKTYVGTELLDINSNNLPNIYYTSYFLYPDDNSTWIKTTIDIPDDVKDYTTSFNIETDIACNSVFAWTNSNSTTGPTCVYKKDNTNEQKFKVVEFKSEKDVIKSKGYWISVSISTYGETICIITSDLPYGSPSNTYYCIQSRDYGENWSIIYGPTTSPLTSVSMS